MQKNAGKISESVAGLGEVKGVRRWYARILAVGHGSSGVHTEAAVRDTGPSAWPIGTKVNINHQGWESAWEQPAGDLNTLAGVIASTPEYVGGDDAGLYAEVEISEAWGPFVEQFKDFIGLSITSSYWGEEYDEPSGLPIVEGYIPSPLNTVDLVTVPGAKGKILKAIESYVEKHGKIVSEQTIPRKEGREVTPEEIQAAIKSAIEDAVPGIIEALTPEAPELVEEDTDVEVVSEAIATANLPGSARKRVYEAVKAGKNVKEAIDAEQAYIKEVSESLAAESKGRIESAATTFDSTQGGWK